MWKYRGALVFGLGLAFSAKAVAFSDWPSVAIAISLLAMHSADRFFALDRAETKLIERVRAAEENLAVVTAFVGQLKAGANLTKSLTSGGPFGGRGL